MSSFADQLAYWHQAIDKTQYRVLSFLLAMGHAGLVLWDPTAYETAVGGINNITGLALIWGICSGVIFGVGFTPRYWVWRLFFSPYISLMILVYLTFQYL